MIVDESKYGSVSRDFLHFKNALMTVGRINDTSRKEV